jgi:hypothetical protein
MIIPSIESAGFVSVIPEENRDRCFGRGSLVFLFYGQRQCGQSARQSFQSS